MTRSGVILLIECRMNSTNCTGEHTLENDERGALVLVLCAQVGPVLQENACTLAPTHPSRVVKRRAAGGVDSVDGSPLVEKQAQQS